MFFNIVNVFYETAALDAAASKSARRRGGPHCAARPERWPPSDRGGAGRASAGTADPGPLRPPTRVYAGRL